MVRNDRPRIWVNSDTLPALKARAVQSNPRYMDWINMVDSHMLGSWDIGVSNYSLAYLITGSVPYADAALALLDLWSADPIGAISGDSGYQCRVVLPGMAVGFDYCYAHLTAAQKTRYISAMEAMADWVWSRPGAWGTDNPGNNYFQGFMMGVWLVGLALSGDSVKATGYLAISEQKYAQMVLPYLSTLGAGGVWLEGESYGSESTRFLFLMLEAHRTATGEDLLTGLPWANDAITAAIHLTTPRRDGKAPFGDQPQTSAAFLGDHDRTAMLIGTRWDARCAPWLDQITPNRNTQRLNFWEEFALWNAPLPLEETR